jgi:hypothetical protein
MAIEHVQTIDRIVPHQLSRVLLRVAMQPRFPEHRESIQLHLAAFADAFNRYSPGHLNSRSLQSWFLNECGWSEFRAAWYRVQIDKALASVLPHQRTQ